MLKKLFKNLGPGPLIAAAFIGPGTVTICTIAGVQFGFDLIWTMVLSIITTIIIQEMSARLGLVSGKSLAEIIRTHTTPAAKRILFTILTISAIAIGNAAYEAGNISGAVMGIEGVFGQMEFELFNLNINFISILIGSIAFALLYTGNYKIIERFMVALVIILSISFLLSAIITQPNVMDILKASFIPKLPDNSILIVIALIGTTVVPYNIFLHSSLVSEKWKGVENLDKAKRDSLVAIILGGIISISIIVTAASVQGIEVKNASSLALGLEPLYGSFAKYVISMGLFAAGITSAITAPLAAAFVSAGLFGWEKNLKDKKFRSVWMLIIIIGVIFSSVNLKAIEIIKFAQISNGLLLPIIAGFLIWSVNKKELMKEFVNGKSLNYLSILILLATVFLGLKSILSVFGISII